MPGSKNFLPDCLRASILTLALALPLAARAGDSPELQRAIKPLADGVPEVAVTRLREVLRGNLREAEKKAATLKLAEALIAAQQPAEAIQLLTQLGLPVDASVSFQRAQALAALRRWSEALPVYQSVAAAAPPPLQMQAVWGAAVALRELGRSDEAGKLFATLLNDPAWTTRARLQISDLALEKNDVASAKLALREVKPASQVEESAKRLLEGRIALAEGRTENATDLFAQILKQTEGVSHQVLVGTLFAMADANLQVKSPESGDDYLEDFIEHHATDPDLPAIFAKLDQLYRAERKPSQNELAHWMHDGAQPRQAFAQWYLARAQLRSGRRDLAEQALDEIRDGAEKHPALAEAMLELARMRLEDGQPDLALRALAAGRAQNPPADVGDRIALQTAEIESRAQHFDAAAPLSEEVARSNPALAPTALYNAALCWLRAGKEDRFRADYQLLSERFPDSDLRQQLVLEQGLLQAGRGEKNAGESLRRFVHDFPASPRVAEAWVALAEMAFHATPPDVKSARENLQRAQQAKPNEAAQEHADYLALWLQDAPLGSNDPQLIALATDFLRKHAGSSLVPEVRMKLAETYFRLQDFPNAQTQFELLAQENAGDSLTEKALFFAGEAAAASMGTASLERAISLFEDVVRLNGEWKWAARNGQAAAERKLDKEQNALALYDEVLKSTASAELKREALCGKGDAQFALGGSDQANYRRAIESFDQLATSAGVTSHWRNQALFKKAKCLENLGDNAGALAACYEVIEGNARPEKTPENFWFSRAGFNGARLLETESKWPSALALYRKIASAGGPRSDEAKARMTRLRLEHFLWDE